MNRQSPSSSRHSPSAPRDGKVLRRRLTSLKVKGIAIAVVRRLAERRHPSIVPDVAVLRVGLHVAEHQVLAFARPCRSLGPAESAGNAMDGGDSQQQRFERRIDDDDVRIRIDVRIGEAPSPPWRVADDRGRRPQCCRLLCRRRCRGQNRSSGALDERPTCSRARLAHGHAFAPGFPRRLARRQPHAFAQVRECYFQLLK